MTKLENPSQFPTIKNKTQNNDQSTMLTFVRRVVQTVLHRLEQCQRSAKIRLMIISRENWWLLHSYVASSPQKWFKI